MKIFCTGGSGFLGQWVKNKAYENDHYFKSFDICNGHDITSYYGLYSAIKNYNPDVVVHAAAIADLYQSDENKDKNFNVNISGTYNVAKACSKLNIPLIYISTCCAYGNQTKLHNQDTTTENDVPRPTEVYAWSKLAGESVLGCVGKLKATVLRLGTFYGPGMRGALFNAIVIEKNLRGETVFVDGDGEQSRQYLHVSDVADAIVLACEKIYDIARILPEEYPEIFNIIGNESISVNDTIDVVNDITTVNTKVVRNERKREGQILRQKISNFNAYQKLGWYPKTNYIDGMRECVMCRTAELVGENEKD